MGARWLSLRELFFVNQIRNASTVHPQLIEDVVELSGRGDFVVNGMYTFEIGLAQRYPHESGEVALAEMGLDGKPTL